jgi:hypothetical protein
MHAPSYPLPETPPPPSSIYTPPYPPMHAPSYPLPETPMYAPPPSYSSLYTQA